VARNGFICGAFTPLSWPADAGTRDDNVADPSGRTFLFSLVNAFGRAVKLRLKSTARSAALMLQHNWGPVFGTHGDLCLIDSRHQTNVKAAECGSFTPASFEVDRAAEASRPAQRPLPSPFFFHHTLSRRGILGAPSFSAAEIEVYQL
jgi:hypothetical protein